jgi:hypothetical protein
MRTIAHIGFGSYRQYSVDYWASSPGRWHMSSEAGCVA